MTSLAEIEQLVQQLYSPSDPAAVSRTQKRLQELQHAQGWQIADGLLQSSDQSARFFGVLTYTVKINQEGSSLTEQNLHKLLETLLGCLIHLLNKNEGLLVLRKLCSTLVTVFVLPNARWKQCIRNILCCLVSGNVESEDVLTTYPATPNLLQALSSRQLTLLLTFATTLAEDAARIEHTSQQFNYCHERVSFNMEDACSIMQYILSSSSALTADSLSDVLKCYEAWIGYAKQEYSSTSEQMERLRMMFEPVVQCLTSEELFETAAEFFIDLFGNSESFFNRRLSSNFAELLRGPWAARLLSALEERDMDPMAVQFGQLVCAFGQASSTAILRAPEEYRHVTEMVHRITRTQCYETIDQTLANIIVDFWETLTSLAETVDEVDGGFRLVGQDWFQAIEELCQASVLPLDVNGEFLRLPSEHTLTELRRRVRDAVNTSCATFGIVVLNKLISMALFVHTQQGVPQCWPLVEAIFNCLGGLSEAVKYEATAEDLAESSLSQLFSSALYRQLTNFGLPVPTRLRKRAIAVIGEHDEFLGSYPDFLLSAIEVLFHCLEYREFAQAASNSVLTLCDANRKVLYPKLAPFMEISERFFAAGQADDISREHIAGSIAAIIQAVPSEQERVTSMQRLMNFVSADYMSRMQSNRGASNDEYLRETKLATLNQLVAVGKASQTPEDYTVDLDAEDDIAAESPWHSTQQTIVELLQTILAESMNDGEIFETACDVLRAGYKERSAGPFVFPPQVSASLITSTTINSPRIDVAIKTAAVFISSNNSKPDRIVAFLPSCLTWLSNLTSQPSIHSDSDVTYTVLDFLSRMLPKHSCHLDTLPTDSVNHLFSISITAVSGAEVLPKKAAAGLWTDLLNLPSSPSAPNPLLTHLLRMLGPQLVHALIFNFGGNAARSQLDWLSDPYRKLVARSGALQVPWKQWTEAVLMSDSFPGNGRVGQKEKERFVKQVEGLRGDRKTTSVIREFWLACRGTPIGYG